MINDKDVGNVLKVLLCQVLLCAVFICCAVASSCVFLFLLDNFRRENEEKKGFSISLLLVTLRNLKNVNQLLFVPLTIWSGIEQGFLVSDYNKVKETGHLFSKFSSVA